MHPHLWQPTDPGRRKVKRKLVAFFIGIFALFTSVSRHSTLTEHSLLWYAWKSCIRGSRESGRGCERDHTSFYICTLYKCENVVASRRVFAQCVSVYNAAVSMWQHGLLCCILKCPKWKYGRDASATMTTTAVVAAVVAMTIAPRQQQFNKQIWKCIRKCVARCKLICKLISYPFH